MSESSTYQYFEEPNPGVLRTVGSDQRILDVGCGFGALGEALKAKGNYVVGLDIESYAIETAGTRIDEAYVCDVTRVGPLEIDGHDPFDLIIFGDVLEHLRPREIHRVVNLCLRTFKKLIIVCPLHDIFQEDLFGNPLEVHRTYVTANFFDRYHPVEKHIVWGRRYTIMNVLIVPDAKIEPFYRRVSWWIFHRCMLLLQPVGLARPFVNLLKKTLIRFRWLLRG